MEQEVFRVRLKSVRIQHRVLHGSCWCYVTSKAVIISAGERFPLEDCTAFRIEDEEMYGGECRWPVALYTLDTYRHLCRETQRDQYQLAASIRTLKGLDPNYAA